MRQAKYDGHTIPVEDDTLSVDEVRDLLVDVMPSIQNAEGHEDVDGNFVYTKKAGTKGK